MDFFGSIGTCKPIIAGRTNQPLDVDQHITCCIIAAACGAVKEHSHRASRSRVIGGIEARPAIEQVRPGPTYQRVVAGATAQRITPRPAGDAVIAAVAYDFVIAGAAAQSVVGVRTQ